MLNTYVVEGGVGKCATFSALVPKLKEKGDLSKGCAKFIIFNIGFNKNCNC